MVQATRESWNTTPMPDNRQALDFRRRFSPAELAQVTSGLIPQEMEDKWFIFREDDQLYFHRSWTGLCCYQVQLRGNQVDAAWFNPEVNLTIGKHQALLEFLIDRLLLGKPVFFAALSGAGQMLTSMVRHHVVGYAQPASPRPPSPPIRPELK